MTYNQFKQHLKCRQLVIIHHRLVNIMYHFLLELYSFLIPLLCEALGQVRKIGFI